MVMIKLLRRQALTQAHTLVNCVLALARDPLTTRRLDACASAARLFEGTAHMAGLHAGAELARTMEECFIAVRRGEIKLKQELIGLMLQGADLLDCMARLSPPPPPRLEVVGGRDWRPRNTGKRVLVVDDSLEVRELERKLLEYRGYEVVTAGDGIDAWNVVRSETFDLVITGVDMPLLDGIRLIRLIRNDARLRPLPILVACNNDNAQQRWCGFDAGADYYVMRTGLQDTLVEAVATLLARRSRNDGRPYLD